MPEIKPYEDMSVELIESSQNPAAKIGLALSITMSNHPDDTIHPTTQKKCQFLLDAEHASVFEHVQFSFLIQNVSRSFLAQITRQRAAHPTSGSQHYQEYQNYPLMVRSDMMGDLPRLALEDSVGMYDMLIKDGCPREEARQLLPNACAVNYLWTIDATNLMKFLRQRLCNRNVTEMRIFANRVLSLAKEVYPQLYNNVGPQCFMDKHFCLPGRACRQGKMQCADKTWIPVV
jgi:thymidylate synthase (FAD)